MRGWKAVGAVTFLVAAALMADNVYLKNGQVYTNCTARYLPDGSVEIRMKGGTVVLVRHYWANKATSILSDAPSEAALHPDLWGYVRFFDKNARGIRMAEPKDLTPAGKATDDGIKLELEEE